MAKTAEQPNFGKYQILDRIAVGGMAEIYKARLDGIGGFHRTFAIKRILPAFSTQPEFVEMLVEEAKVAGLLSHANIVQILDLGQVDGTYFIAMEFVDGPDLGRVLKRCRAKGITLPIPHAVFILTEVLKGLEYAHDRKVMRGGQPVPLQIVHRDICPANVLVSFKGEIKLTDFGIAKASVRNLETISGVVKGRFDYLSPEQARGEEVDRRSDLFSAGVLLYEMLTGRHPFARPRQPDTLTAIKTCDHRPPSHFNSDVPAALDLLISQTLHPDPGQRFRSATAMKDALDRFFHESGFIFSHSTLAAFLRGLFPEGESSPPLDTSSVDEADLETRPIHRGELLREDAPTHDSSSDTDEPGDLARKIAKLGISGDTTLRRSALDMTKIKDYAASNVFGPVGEDSTVVGVAPNLDMSEWAEAETVIRSRLEELDTDQASAEDAEPTHAKPESDMDLALPLPEPSDRIPPPPRHSRRRTPTYIRRTQVLIIALVLVIVVVALLVSFVMGHRAAQQSGSRQAQIAVKNRPKLEVHMPEGGVLYVDGLSVPGSSPVQVPLTAGRSHDIRVTVPDHLPVETSIRLNYNDVRIMQFDQRYLETRPKGRRR